MTDFLTNKSAFVAIAITAIIILACPVTSLCGSSSEQVINLDGHCDKGLQKQPNGPMAVINFCEGALGNYIGLVYYEPMGGPVPVGFHGTLSKEEQKNYYKVWSLNNRMWQESIWSSNVTSYAWSSDGKKLFVSTSGIYGSGCLFELDLIKREYKQIAPEEKQYTTSDPGPGFLITSINSEYLSYKITAEDWPVKVDTTEKNYKIKNR